MGKKVAQVLAKVCQNVMPPVARFTCLATFIVQCCLLDYYLVAYTSRNIQTEKPGINGTDIYEADINYIWCLWAIPDVVCVALYIMAFVYANRYLKKQKKVDKDETASADKDAAKDQVPAKDQAAEDASAEPHKIAGELPFGYVAWGISSIFVSIKVGILFINTAQTLKETDMFGPNMLKTAITLSSIVFMTLVLTHHDAPPDSTQEAFIHSLTTSVTFDIMDTTDFLDVLFIQQSHLFTSFGMHRTIVAVACFNLVLPTLLLFVLSQSHYGKKYKTLKTMKLIHKILYTILINLPMLVLRMVLWHAKNQNVSVFLVKNFMSLGTTAYVIHLHARAVNRATVTNEYEMQPCTGGDLAPEANEPGPSSGLMQPPGAGVEESSLSAGVATRPAGRDNPDSITAL